MLTLYIPVHKVADFGTNKAVLYSYILLVLSIILYVIFLYIDRLVFQLYLL
jgi:hypothetical protein